MVSQREYLKDLTGKIFKLLPMREEYNDGTDNHLLDYVENLSANLRGALYTYADLASNASFVTVVNNISALIPDKIPSMKRWKSIVLYSTNVVSALAEEQ